MPERNFDALDADRRKTAIEHVPGYDWIPGKFGPPPGIPKPRKDEFDRMSDKKYLYSFLKLSQEEKESLMVSEAERRRTFAAHWPIESIVKGNDCAKEGFYYTGVADRVQCAFCGGIVRNWERGDIPKFQHKNFFNYCKIVQNRPCQNIPYSSSQLPKDLMTSQLSSSVRGDCKQTNLHDLNINTCRPKNPALSVSSKRMETFTKYPDANPVKANKLCDAGFVYDKVGDRVKCFWCDGCLESWSEGDEPWVEHAKWFPGCTFVQQTKGLKFIKSARLQLTADNVDAANSVQYNKGDVSFLEDINAAVSELIPVEELSGFQFCSLLGYEEELIKRAYEANNNVEFKDQAKLIEIVQDLDDGISLSLENHKKEIEQSSMEITTQGSGASIAKPGKRINVPDLITKPNDPTETECDDLINCIRCKVCRKNMSGAVVLPCGCFCLCQECSRGNLPRQCPACSGTVNGACRTFLS